MIIIIIIIMIIIMMLCRENSFTWVRILNNFMYTLHIYTLSMHAQLPASTMHLHTCTLYGHFKRQKHTCMHMQAHPKQLHRFLNNF
uniref:Uncharacterized protein n=1 Tax=Octopus bimaculoides TaxID=37653 RepID=A0A0L8HDK1_OCTBM